MLCLRMALAIGYSKEGCRGDVEGDVDGDVGGEGVDSVELV